MHGKDQDYLSDIYAVIGRAVSALIEAGEPLSKKNVLIMLQTHSSQTTDEQLKAVYQQAFRNLLESFH